MTSSLLELDSDVRLTHYRLQKIGEQSLDLSSGDLIKLKPTAVAKLFVEYFENDISGRKTVRSGTSVDSGLPPFPWHLRGLH